MTKKKDPKDILPPGRPTDYKSDYHDNQVFKLCLLGLTDKQICTFFGIKKATLNQWKKKHPTFIDSIRAGKNEADAEVSHSLYNRAKGMVIDQETVMKIRVAEDQEEVQVVKFKQAFPPDTRAAEHWLRVRQKKQRDPSQKVDTTIANKDNKPLKLEEVKSMTDSDLSLYLQQQLSGSTPKT